MFAHNRFNVELTTSPRVFFNSLSKPEFGELLE